MLERKSVSSVVLDLELDPAFGSWFRLVCFRRLQQNDPRNHTNNATSCGFVDRFPWLADLSISGNRTLPAFEHSGHHHKGAEMISIVIGDQESFLQNRLAGAVRNPGKEIGRGIRDQRFHLF